MTPLSRQPRLPLYLPSAPLPQHPVPSPCPVSYLVKHSRASSDAPWPPQLGCLTERFTFHQYDLHMTDLTALNRILHHLNEMNTA